MIKYDAVSDGMRKKDFADALNSLQYDARLDPRLLARMWHGVMPEDEQPLMQAALTAFELMLDAKGTKKPPT